MRYSGVTPETRKEMLAAAGAQSAEDLLSSIPKDVRSDGSLRIDGPVAEGDLRARLEAMKGRTPRHAFVGGGLYSHFIPADVDSVCARSEWLTSYTPYQAEISQGTLVMYYEYQTYIAMLTGQEIANGGMYDGSTSMVEAVLMAMRVREKAEKVYVSGALNPEYAAVLRTYMRFSGGEVVTLPFDRKTGRTDFTAAPAGELAKAACVVVQSPNFFGVIEDAAGLTPDAFVVSVCTEAMAMPIVPPLRAHIATGDTQSFGIPIQLGGPTAGFFATRKEWVRKMPGRLVGRTKDDQGREAFCITLATREQFIRRDRATSNICTSSGLMCLRSTVYMTLLGRKGLEDVARKNASAARFFAAGLAKLGCKPAFTGSYFNELVVDLGAKPGLYEKLLEQDIVLGLPLGPRFEGMKDHYLVTLTEQHYTNAQAILEEVTRAALR
jgi:glycine dehydrogenase subunit 1